MDLLEVEQSEDKTPPGRKFLMGKYVLLLSTLGYLMTAIAVPLSTNFAIFIGGLATLYTIYCGGNISSRWVDGRPTTKVVLDRRQVSIPINTETKTTDSDKPVGG